MQKLLHKELGIVGVLLLRGLDLDPFLKLVIVMAIVPLFMNGIQVMFENSIVIM